jgi:hypothetical protein
LKNGAFPVTECFPMLMCWHVKYAFALIIMKLRGIRLEKNKIKNKFFFEKNLFKKKYFDMVMLKINFKK